MFINVATANFLVFLFMLIYYKIDILFLVVFRDIRSTFEDLNRKALVDSRMPAQLECFGQSNVSFIFLPFMIFSYLVNVLKPMVKAFANF